jgi:hypothetical protein
MNTTKHHEDCPCFRCCDRRADENNRVIGAARPHADSVRVQRASHETLVAALRARIAEVRELKASVVKRENYEVAYGWSCHIAGLEWALQRIESAATGGNE